VNWYLAVLKNYAGFSGRARRKEYFMFLLFNFIAALVLAIIDNVVGTRMLAPIYGLAVLLPTFALCFRRLHDTGRSAGWLFIALIPVIGQIVLLIFYVQDSEPGTNKYGPNPKELPAQA
jgi:uncharacterized membrane protein YhaH (DUF805 family)